MRRFLTAASLLVLALSSFADDLDDRVIRALKDSARPASSARADGLFKEQKFVEAAKAYTDYVTRRPDDAGAWYNLACALSKAGRTAAAANALQGAFLAGYSDLEHVKGDADLAALRATKGYEMALKAFRANKPINVEVLWVEAEAFFRLEITKPKKYDAAKQYGMVLLLHGGVGTADAFIRSVPDWPGDEFVVAALESPYPAAEADGTQGYSWFLPGGSPQDGTRAGELVVKQVEKAIAKVQASVSIDPKKIYLVGSSAGAYLTAQCVSAFGEKLAGAVFNSGGGNPGGSLEKWKGKRLLISHGVNDPIIAPKMQAEFAKSLEAAGVQCELYWYDGEHALTQKMIEGIGKWLRGEEIPAELKAAEPK